MSTSKAKLPTVCPGHKHDDALDALSTGPRIWRTLDELADSPEFAEKMHREFPAAASEWDDSLSRRNFLKVMGASVALAGLAGACSQRPTEKIVPYVQQPEQIIPGRPLFFASAMTFDGFGKGVLVEQHEGRPTKIEGNKHHPASLGAADVFMQASILSLYDPDRSQLPTRGGAVSTWNSFEIALANLAAAKRAAGAPLRVRVLTETVTSPTLTAQLKALEATVGKENFGWHAYAPTARNNAREAARRAFGRDVTVVHDFRKAKVVLAIDSNFLCDEPGSLAYARQFIGRRRVRFNDAAKSLHAPRTTLFTLESSPTVTGAVADYLLRLAPGQVTEIGRRIARAAVGDGKIATDLPGVEGEGAKKKLAEFLSEVVHDLREAKGESIVICGEWQPPEMHALVHALNAELGNIGAGKPVSLIPAVETSPAGLASLAELTSDLKGGAVDVLLILGGNPAYTAPADLAFADTLRAFSEVQESAGKLKNLTVHLALHSDETSAVCQWHLPQSHYLESWGDVRAYDGTASIVQPLIAPLYAGTRSEIETVVSVQAMLQRGAAPAAQPGAPATQPTVLSAASGAYDLVRATWRAWQKDKGGDFEAFWYDCLTQGVIPGSNADYKPADAAATVKVADLAGDAAAAASKDIALIIRPDPNIWDGSFANNAWLQELPKPLTKLTWDNAVLMSLGTAIRLGLAAEAKFDVMDLLPTEANNKLVNVSVGDAKLEGVPVWVVPGHPDGCVTLHLGYGRAAGGKVASPDDHKVGFNVYRLRSSSAPWYVTNGTVSRAEGEYKLACTQGHQVIDKKTNELRDLVRWGKAEQVAHQAHDKHEAHQTHRRVQLNILNAPDQHAAGDKLLGQNDAIPDDPAYGTSLFPENPGHPGGHNKNYPAWGMVIDMTACIGCNACVVACQAENNIPVVGRDGVLREREMHWLRIDTYYVAAEEGREVGIEPTGTFFQPLPCMHCEKAPCEVVCPVAATTHSMEGLNEMTYNRCVGTRYCSNNCPYKVRRFNFFNYTRQDAPAIQLQRNPEVTVRTRGVMEKCTYCVQRINRGRIEAKKYLSMAGTGEMPAGEAAQNYRNALDSIVTACQQTCPTKAITFGDMSSEGSAVWKLKHEPTNYALLAEAQTQPRTTYLPRVVNNKEGNKDAVKAAHGGHGHEHKGGGH